MRALRYIESLNARYRTGISTEHSYRSDLLNLIESLVPGISITNEPKRVACGAPDYIITRHNIPIGYIEAKDLGADLNSKTYKEQFDRYKQSLDNLIITDYLTFQFFVNGSATTSITVGEISDNKVHPIPDNFEIFIDLIENFCEYTGQTIKSAQKLSRMMAAKAKLLANVIELAVGPHNDTESVNELQNINLLSQYESFKQVLIHDITPKAFADIYAQTIAYGMFAARLNDPSLENFTRQEASELIPRSNPFLRKLFQYIAGYDLDDRIVWIVDALADIFRATNVEEMLKDFGKATHQTDPFIHFYETFLAEYDPKLRKSRGVWYTPEPVVNFIVRAVDDILKTEFGLLQGLADTTMIKIKIPGQQKKHIEKEVHKVQILDPAVGTGTFLAEVVKQIHDQFKSQQGIWSQYVDDHLIPRLNGFELLMASYTMAHLKLEMLLRDTGHEPIKDQRLRLYLTNSLEEHHPDTGTLFANWLSSEANEANQVKRDTPIMIVLGNPPYAISSSNKGEWIQKLISDYKFNLNEKKINIDDDYIKFIRYGQYYIDKNGSGILAFITNNSFIDGITHRRMRERLLSSFDRIYVLDLHGNSRKKETSTDGIPDENVFDIMQGVSINIFVRSNKYLGKHEFGEVFYYSVFGDRESKYKFLMQNSLVSIPWETINPVEPFYFFVPKDFSGKDWYDKGFKLDDLFIESNTGIQTKRDALVYHFDLTNLMSVIKDICELPRETIRDKYKLPADGRDWTVDLARNDLNRRDGVTINVLYHPFDKRITYFTGRSKGFMAYPRSPLSLSCLKDNISLLTIRNTRTDKITNYFIADCLADKDGVSPLDNCRFFPLFLYSKFDQIEGDSESETRKPNLNNAIIEQISKSIGLRFSEKRVNENEFDPLDVFDYIYAVLYSPAYRLRFKAFLKIDLPRIPLPNDKSQFRNLIKLGSELRQIHLLKISNLDGFITAYPMPGSNEILKYVYEDGKVWINEDQYFDNVPELAWEFFIGGYQPAKKWLKDRKGRALSFDDIMHFQKIIIALTETDRLMKEIDKIDFLP